MATRRTKQKEEEPDLLAGLEEPAAPEEDELDLLDGITDDNGTAWMPWDDEDQPDGIQGRVTYIGSVDSDYGDKDTVPLVELEAKDGTLWSIRAYGTAMRSQVEKTDPQVGDFFAIKYLGEKQSKKRGKDYHNVKAAVKHR